MFLLSLVACLSSERPEVAPSISEVDDVTDPTDTEHRDFSFEDLPGVGGTSVPPALSATLEPNEDIGTVATVRWESEAASDGWVEITEEGTSATRVFVDEEERATHEVLVVGLAAGTAYRWRAVSQLPDGSLRASEPAGFVTSAAPSWLPEIEVTSTGDQALGGYVLTTVTGSRTGVFMLDARGRYVWWWRADDDATACQARLARDGRSVWVLEQDEQFRADLGQMTRVDLEGNVVTSVPAPLAHHDFLELADGRIAYLAVDVGQANGEAVAGDALELLDPNTGAHTTFWSTWDDLTPPAEIDDTGFYGFAEDWTHANGLFRDEATGDWLVSLHSLDAVVRVSAEGRLEWQLGGTDSDFTLTSGEAFVRQHSPSLTPNGLLIFDNNAQGDNHLYSQAVEYAIDEDAMTYGARWSSGDMGEYTLARGSAERLATGAMLLGYGSSGRIRELAPDGSVALDVSVTEDGRPLSFANFVATLGER